MIETLAGDQNGFHVGKLIDSFTLHISWFWQICHCTFHTEKRKVKEKEVIKQALKTVENVGFLELNN